jgi:psiF repeat
MKNYLTLLAMGLSLSFGTAHAADAPAAAGAAKTPQQTNMEACNKEATDKKGDERKTFMKECLSK